MSQNTDAFDLMDANGEAQAPNKPFWVLDFEDEKKMRDWLVRTFDQLEEDRRPRVEVMKKNLAMFKGIHFHAQDTQTREILTRSPVRMQKVPRVIINHIFENIEQHVSRLTKFRPAITVDPANDDHRDKMAAKITAEVIEAAWYRADVDNLFQMIAKARRLLGETYLGITWDEYIGDLHPDSKDEIEKARLEGKDKPRTKLIGDDGKQVLSTSGDPLFIDEPVRMGDVRFDVLPAWQVFLQRKREYKDCEYAFYRDVMDIEDVKADHPDKASEVKQSKNGMYFDPDTLEERQLHNEVEVFYFWHRRTRRLDGGRMVKFTRDVVLENKSNPYEHGDFPWVRTTDIDVPGSLDGVSTTEIARPIQTQHNNSTSMILRNQSLFAHPKWMVPAGSVKLTSLGNDATIVQYQGPNAPRLATPSPTPGEVFAFTDTLEQKIGQIMGVHQISRGAPPPGIKAGVALQFLEEQENERSNSIVAKHNNMIRQVAMLTAAVCGQYYDTDKDEFKIRINNLLGPEKAAYSEYFEMADLTNIHDIRLQTSSALPQQKSARVQTVLDLRESFPGRITDDQALEMLDFGMPDKFIDINTAALRKAEMENEVILSGGAGHSPEVYEHQIVHYREHMRALNEKVFSDAPNKIKEKLKDHIMAHEYLILKIARRYPQIIEEVSTEFPQFPVFFVEAEQVAEPQPEDADIEALLQQQQMGMEEPQMAGAEAYPPPGPQETPIAPMNQEIIPGSENAAPIQEPPLEGGM